MQNSTTAAGSAFGDSVVGQCHDTVPGFQELSDSARRLIARSHILRMKPARRPAHPDSVASARSTALGWLATRELSEAQVRQRLGRRGYSNEAIEQAVTELVAGRTIDEFSRQVREKVDLDALGSELVGAVATTVQPRHVSLWLRPPDAR